MDNVYLQHHGVKGQRWGRRRYQNKDGSLTPAGKKRRAAEEDVSSLSDEELRSRINRLNLEKRYTNLSRSKGSNVLGTAGKVTSMGSDAGNIAKNANKLRGKSSQGADLASKGADVATKSISAASKIKNISDEKKLVKRTKPKLESMSDEELRKVVNRMDMEQQYSSLKSESVSRGKVSAGQVLSIAGDVLAVGASATAIAVAIYNLKKG